MHQFGVLLTNMLAERQQGKERLCHMLADAGYEGYSLHSVDRLITDPTSVGLPLEFLWALRNTLNLTDEEYCRLSYAYHSGRDLFGGLTPLSVAALIPVSVPTLALGSSVLLLFSLLI